MKTRRDDRCFLPHFHRPLWFRTMDEPAQQSTHACRVRWTAIGDSKETEARGEAEAVAALSHRGPDSEPRILRRGGRHEVLEEQML